MDPLAIHYSEKQRFRQWWIWMLVVTEAMIFLSIAFMQLVMRSPVGDSPLPDYLVALLAVLLGGGFPLFMYSIGLDTEVTSSGVCIRFRPFHRRWRVFNFDNIQKADAVTYSPLKDYGGWGIRYGLKGKAYNVSGNKGVLIMFKDRGNILIGSNKHELLYCAINERLSV